MFDAPSYASSGNRRRPPCIQFHRCRYGLLIAVDAVAGRSTTVTSGYYGLAILPALAGFMMATWVSRVRQANSSRPIAQFRVVSVDRARCGFRLGGISGFRITRFGMISRMGLMLKSVGSRPLRFLVHVIDAALRRVLAITEIEAETESVFRIKLGSAEREILLSDGTRVRRGDAVLELHLWNEKLEPVPSERSELGWAVRFRQHFLASLHRLAIHLQRDPNLAAVRAIHMQPAIERKRPAGAIERMLPKVGFEPIPPVAPGPGRLYRFLENAWLWLLTWAHNPRALRGRQFDRTRRGFWISRSQLLARHGAAFPERLPTAGADRPVPVVPAMREAPVMLRVEGGAE